MLNKYVSASLLPEDQLEQAKRISAEAKSLAWEAADLARDAAEGFSAKVRDDYVPKVSAAVAAASKAISSDSKLFKPASKVSDVAMSEEVELPKKSSLTKPWLICLLISVLAVVGVVAWRRTRPVEDPWAEESWEDIDDEDLIVINAADSDSDK